jgi:hypothetical protein
MNIVLVIPIPLLEFNQFQGMRIKPHAERKKNTNKAETKTTNPPFFAQASPKASRTGT